MPDKIYWTFRDLAGTFRDLGRAIAAKAGRAGDLELELAIEDALYETLADCEVEYAELAAKFDDAEEKNADLKEGRVILNAIKELIT